MKKLLPIFIIIISIVLIPGCINEEKKESENPASSPDDQTPRTQKTESILRKSDVPGLTLDTGSRFYAVLDNSRYTFGDDSNIMKYTDTLEIGYRNVGENSEWKDEFGREVRVILRKYDPDSESGLIESLITSINNLDEIVEANAQENGIVMEYGKLDIGDVSYYQTDFNPKTGFENTIINFAYRSNLVNVQVIDEEGISRKEAIRIAGIIESRLD